MDTTSSSTANLAKSGDQVVWHPGTEAASFQGANRGGATGKGTCTKRRVILISWDRSRDFIFAGFSIAFVIWAAVFFPLIVK